MKKLFLSSALALCMVFSSLSFVMADGSIENSSPIDNTSIDSTTNTNSVSSEGETPMSIDNESTESTNAIASTTFTSIATAYGNIYDNYVWGNHITGNYQYGKFTCRAQFNSGEYIHGECEVYTRVGMDGELVTRVAVDQLNPVVTQDVWMVGGQDYYVSAFYGEHTLDSDNYIKANLTYTK